MLRVNSFRIISQLDLMADLGRTGRISFIIVNMYSTVLSAVPLELTVSEQNWATVTTLG